MSLAIQWLGMAVMCVRTIIDDLGIRILCARHVNGAVIQLLNVICWRWPSSWSITLSRP
jgi:hypothetical protein